MHRIWANDLPDNCIDDMEALHLEEEGPSPNLLFFVFCCPFQSLERLSRGKRRVKDLSVRRVRSDGQMGVKNLRWRNPNRRVATQS